MITHQKNSEFWMDTPMFAQVDDVIYFTSTDILVNQDESWTYHYQTFRYTDELDVLTQHTCAMTYSEWESRIPVDDCYRRDMRVFDTDDMFYYTEWRPTDSKIKIVQKGSDEVESINLGGIVDNVIIFEDKIIYQFLVEGSYGGYSQRKIYNRETGESQIATVRKNEDFGRVASNDRIAVYTYVDNPNRFVLYDNHDNQYYDYYVRDLELDGWPKFYLDGNTIYVTNTSNEHGLQISIYKLVEETNKPE